MHIVQTLLMIHLCWVILVKYLQPPQNICFSSKALPVLLLGTKKLEEGRHSQPAGGNNFKKSGQNYLSVEFWILKICWTVQKLQFYCYIYNNTNSRMIRMYTDYKEDYMDMKMIVETREKLQT